MKIYNTKTLEDYDALMSELEEKDYSWLTGQKPTYFRYWEKYGVNTCVRTLDKYIMFSNIGLYIDEYPDVAIIEYKSKGENMTQEKIKQELEEILDNASVAVSWALKDTSTVEAGLSEAKSSAKKLVEKIDDYLESRKPKFKVGDYVVEDENYITKIEKINSKGIPKGHFYDREINRLSLISVGVSSSTARLATPEEIVEYKVALIFYKHGRKPFEVKEGDLIEYPNGHNIMIYYPEIFSKADFLNDGFKLIKTAEEVNEWIKGE